MMMLEVTNCVWKNRSTGIWSGSWKPSMISISRAWGKGVWLRASRSRPMKHEGEVSPVWSTMKDTGLETQLDHSNLKSFPECFRHFSEGRGYQFSGNVPRNVLSFFCRSMVIKVSNPSLGSAPCKSVCGPSSARFHSSRLLFWLLSWATRQVLRKTILITHLSKLEPKW